MDTAGFGHTTTCLQVSQKNHFGPHFGSSVEKFGPPRCQFVRLFSHRAIRKPDAIRFFHSRSIPRTQKMIRKNLINKTMFEIVPSRDIPTTEIFRHMMIHLGKHGKNWKGTSEPKQFATVCWSNRVQFTLPGSKGFTCLMTQLVQGSGTGVGKATLPPIHHCHVAACAKWLTLTH